MNKRKVVNDPVYGFISIPNEFIYDLIEHPYFQRLRRIKQLGLTHLVYPGAMHTRFSHALGAMHLLNLAVQTLRSKGNDISHAECTSALAAILFHDIGHGPFSHALESELVIGLHHEEISLRLMHEINNQMNGALDECIAIFTGTHPKNYLHELVSSQLDMDRLDYLNRDTYFTGVSEGIVGWDRIIKMLAVHQGKLVVEEKGIHSLEKFVIARRIMYWQVYLHKTALSAELMLMSTLRRARDLVKTGEKIEGSDALLFFLEKGHIEDLSSEVLRAFCELDDADIAYAIKQWKSNKDPILSELSDRLLKRRLFKLKFFDDAVSNEVLSLTSNKVKAHPVYNSEYSPYFVLSGSVSNITYSTNNKEILLMNKEGKTKSLDVMSDLLPTGAGNAGELRKHYLCVPEDLL